MVDVAVILINYNASDFTLKCITSVIEKTKEAVSYEIIVTDNNSEIADYENLKKNFPTDPRCKLVRSNLNTGFGGGNMFGARLANARYLLFLNNDALLLNNCLEILTGFMDTNKSVGVSTAQNYDEHNRLVPSFDHNKGLRRLLFGRGFLQKANLKRYPDRKLNYKNPIKVDWVNGAFLFFRKDAFEEIGGFDPNVFLYWEEMDLCHRLKRKGYTTMLVPGAKILHYQGVSIGKSKEINKEAYRSYLYVIRKNFGFLKAFLIQLYLFVVLLLKPKKWYLLGTILEGSSMKNSMRHNQKERFYEG
ncbi:MAG: glycosyltransferase family 2 protein [Bacteroidia bacterium]|nr:glycosyltransferase family 2 protein [Bacteroidia bacterium]MBT8275494.1 glycosyltransferase family 2 protein [Bacteroidia bacterium]NNJ81416.1 glycosyltransferase family 2 protein [Flavobacteriaceae bacterium]NNK54426.1 glycosyltransferase family 2 protein [Flavobacteriaceae bacterium]